MCTSQTHMNVSTYVRKIHFYWFHAKKVKISRNIRTRAHDYKLYTVIIRFLQMNMSETIMSARSDTFLPLHKAKEFTCLKVQ